MIPPGDGKRLKTLLPQTEIDNKEANVEHARQMQAVATRATKSLGQEQRCPKTVHALIAPKSFLTPLLT